MGDRQDSELARTGVKGLDQVLGGGLPRDALYTIHGAPGTGKTTLALQFLAEGQCRGERTLFITVSQSASDLHRIARSHGIPLDGMRVEEVYARPNTTAFVGSALVLPSTQCELSGLMNGIHELIENNAVDRFVLDSLVELRLLSDGMLSYQRELVLLRDLVIEVGATGLIIDTIFDDRGDRQLRALAHGVIELEADPPGYGSNLRRLNVVKVRGHSFIEGYHDVAIRRGGLEVFPRILPSHCPASVSEEHVSSGIDALDEMLGGGLEPGTTCVIVGQSGTGKSVVGSAFAHAAASEGLPAALFLLEERPELYRLRSRNLRLDLEPLERNGTLRLSRFDPMEASPGEFFQAVLDTVEECGTRLVVIDSLSGFMHAFPNGFDLTSQMHALVAYLAQRNVLTILTLTIRGLLDNNPALEIDASYLADTAIYLRFDENSDEFWRTIAVVKKRHGAHEHHVRDFRISENGVEVGRRRRRVAFPPTQHNIAASS